MNIWKKYYIGIGDAYQIHPHNEDDREDKVVRAIEEQPGCNFIDLERSSFGDNVEFIFESCNEDSVNELKKTYEVYEENGPDSVADEMGVAIGSIDDWLSGKVTADEL